MKAVTQRNVLFFWGEGDQNVSSHWGFDCYIPKTDESDKRESAQSLSSSRFFFPHTNTPISFCERVFHRDKGRLFESAVMLHPVLLRRADHTENPFSDVKLVLVNLFLTLGGFMRGYCSSTNKMKQMDKQKQGNGPDQHLRAGSLSASVSVYVRQTMTVTRVLISHSLVRSHSASAVGSGTTVYTLGVSQF